MAGRTQIAWRGPSVVAAFRRGGRVGLEDTVAEILVDSQKIVPFEKGELSRSGRSGMVNDTTGAVTYLAPSAVPAHERLEIPPGHGRQRKYLETPLMTGRSRYARVLAARIRREAGT